MLKLNKGSFYLTLACLILLIVMPSNNFITSVTGLHKFSILLIITMIAFVLSVLGMAGIKNGKSALLSSFTIGVTVLLMLFLGVVMFFGKLLS